VEYYHVVNEAKDEPLNTFRMIVGPKWVTRPESYTLCADAADDNLLVYIYT
jgi:hypothetical protein